MIKRKERKKRKKIRERGTGWCMLPERKRPRQAAINGDMELAGVGQKEAMVHGFRFRLNWEKEESDASPFQTINAVEEAVSEKVHGGAMAGSSLE